MQKSALVASLLAAALLACGGDFNKPSLLDKPRILAVRAEPPQPSFGQTTTLSTLVYQPPLDRVADKCPSPGQTTYHWRWCPVAMVADSVTNTYKCPFPEDGFQQLYASLGMGAPPPFDLGEGETMTFTNPFPAQLLYDLCRGYIASSLTGGVGEGTSDAGAARSIFTCDKAAEDYKTDDVSKTHPISFSMTIMVTVTPACPGLLPEHFNPLSALYSLHLPTNDTIPTNQNPVISGIFATENFDPIEAVPPTTSPDDGVGGGDAAAASPDGGFDDGSADGGVAGGGATDLDGGQSGADAGHDAPDGAVPLEEQPLVTVKRDKHVGLMLDIDIGTAEPLAAPAVIDYDSTRNVTRHYEHLSFTWFSEAGTFNGKVSDHQSGYLPEPWGPDENPPYPSAKDLQNFQDNINNRLDLPKHEDYQHDVARIIVVVRDGRGGVAWTTRQVTLEPTP